MEAWDERASIVWARVTRGTSSMANEVTLPAASSRTMSRLRCGARKPISTAPGFSPSASCPGNPSKTPGGVTLSTTSAVSQAPATPVGSTGSGINRAPAASKAASENREPSPAPRSTVTSSPSLIIRFTVSGVAATRVSFGRLSRGTKTFTMDA